MIQVYIYGDIQWILGQKPCRIYTRTERTNEMDLGRTAKPVKAGGATWECQPPATEVRGVIWGFPKIRVTLWGAPIIRTLVFWDLY